MVLLIWQNEALFLDCIKTQSAGLMRMLCVCLLQLLPFEILKLKNPNLRITDLVCFCGTKVDQE